MGCPSQSTTTQSTQANPVAQQAYQTVLGQAQNVAGQPYQAYTGALQAGLTPDQLQAIGTTRATQGLSQPYINAAANNFTTASQPIVPMNFSGDAVTSLQSPYIQDVVDATRAQFADQNARQNSIIAGNAASQNALGGDRAAIAQSIAAGQEQLAQAPVIAGLYNTGYNTALGEFNALNQAQIGAQQATGWLQQGAGYGLANLGAEAQSQALSGAGALMSVGALGQQQAQQQLNLPYEQFVAEQAYPFQTTGWGANIAEGIGSGLGGTAATTSPGPSAISQLAGAGVAGLGLYGLGQNQGWWGSGSSGLITGSTAPGMTDWSNLATGDFGGAILANRGGRIGRAIGGASLGLPPAPGNAISVPTGVPDLSVSFVPQGAVGQHASGLGASVFQPNTTTTTSGGGGSGILGAIGPAISVAKLFARNGGEIPHRVTGGGTPTSLYVHDAAPSVALPTASPATAAPATLSDIAPVTNYAVNFGPGGWPVGVRTAAPGESLGTPAIALGLNNGIFARGLPPNLNSDGTLAASSAPATLAAPPLSVADPTGNDAAQQQIAAQDTFNVSLGGGGWRGGRMGRDGGGATQSLSGGTSLALVPDLSQTFVPKYQPSRQAGSGLPRSPAAQPQQDPLKDATGLTQAISSLDKLWGSGGDGKAFGGAVSLSDAGMGFDYGGSVEQAGATASGGMNPMMAGVYQQFMQMPTENLQELWQQSQSDPRMSQYRGIIANALRMKRMAPEQMPQQTPGGASLAGPVAPSSPSIGTPTLGQWRGGRLHRDEGGGLDPGDLPGQNRDLDIPYSEPGQVYFPEKNEPTVTQSALQRGRHVLPDPSEAQDLQLKSLGVPPPSHTNDGSGVHEADMPETYLSLVPRATETAPSPAPADLATGPLNPNDNTLAAPPPARNLGHVNMLTAPKADYSNRLQLANSYADALDRGFRGTIDEFAAGRSPNIGNAPLSASPAGGGENAPAGGVPPFAVSSSAPKALDPAGIKNVQTVIQTGRDLHLSDAAIKGILANGLGEGGFNQAWGKAGGAENSFGHWQFNERGELPGYMSFLKSANLPNDTHSQMMYVAKRMEEIHPGFSQITDPLKATDLVATSFEKYRGAKPGQRYGLLNNAERIMAGDYGVSLGPSGQPVGKAANASDLGTGPEDQIVAGLRHDLSGIQKTAAEFDANQPAANQLLQNQRSQLEHDRQSSLGASPWLPVVAAGFGMMASKSPFPGVAIGEGGLAGVKTVENQQAISQKAALTEARMQAIENQAQHFAEMAQVKRDSISAQMAQTAARLQEAIRYHDQLQAKGQDATQARIFVAQLQNDYRNLDEQRKRDADAWRREHQTTQDYLRQLQISKPMPGYNEQGIPGAWTLDPDKYARHEPNPYTFTPGDTVGHAPHAAGRQKYDLYLSVHPGDKEGALAYANGQKQMSDGEASKAALATATREKLAATSDPANAMYGVFKKMTPEQANAWTQERAGQLFHQIKNNFAEGAEPTGAVPQTAPAKPSPASPQGAAPIPAWATPDPRNGVATMNGKPIYLKGNAWYYGDQTPVSAPVNQ